MAIKLKQRTFTVDEYHRMARAGLFDAGPPVELLDGLVVEMPPIGKRHWATHNRIVRYLHLTLAGLAEVPGQLSVPLGERNEPQPDIAVLALSALEDDFRRIEAAEILAMIELADSSLPQDLGPKRLLYARFGIPNYLVVDLRRGVLLNYNAPSNGDYGDLQVLRRGETFALAALSGALLEASAFLPQSPTP